MRTLAGDQPADQRRRRRQMNDRRIDSRSAFRETDEMRARARGVFQKPFDLVEKAARLADLQFRQGEAA